MGVRNTLGDLNNHLFEQLERLNSDSVKGENLKEEIQRAKAMSDIADNVIKNGSLVLEGQKIMNDRMDADEELPRMLKGK